MKVPKSKPTPAPKQTQMGNMITNPNTNRKPKLKRDCLDCGFAREVCCKYNNGSASCQKPSDCPNYTSMRQNTI